MLPIDWCRNIRNDNALVLPAHSPTIHCCGQPIRRGGDSAISRSGFYPVVPQCPSATTRLIQGNQLSGLTDAEPGLSHLSSSLLRSAGSWDPPTRSRSSFWCCTPPSESPACSNQIWISQQRRAGAVRRSRSPRSGPTNQGRDGHVVHRWPPGFGPDLGHVDELAEMIIAPAR